jgi:hypothetical protein
VVEFLEMCAEKEADLSLISPSTILFNNFIFLSLCASSKRMPQTFACQPVLEVITLLARAMLTLRGHFWRASCLPC